MFCLHHTQFLHHDAQFHDELCHELSLHDEGTGQQREMCVWIGLEKLGD